MRNKLETTAHGLTIALASLILACGPALTYLVLAQKRLHEFTAREAHVGVLLTAMASRLHGQTLRPSDVASPLAELRAASEGLNLGIELNVLASAMAKLDPATAGRTLDKIAQAHRAAAEAARRASERGHALAEIALLLTMWVSVALVVCVIWLNVYPAPKP
jgi:hypothetical protein